MAEDDTPDRDTKEPRERELEPLGDVVAHLLRRIVDRGRQQINRAATSGRTRLELRQLRADRDRFWIRLGKTAYRLVESGELDHPAIRKAMVRIDELDEQIRRLEDEGAAAEGE